jgi:hypothetical protein
MCFIASAISDERGDAVGYRSREGRRSVTNDSAVTCVVSFRIGAEVCSLILFLLCDVSFGFLSEQNSSRLRIDFIRHPVDPMRPQSESYKVGYSSRDI